MFYGFFPRIYRLSQDKFIASVLPDGLLDYFELVECEKYADHYDIFLDELPVLNKEDRKRRVQSKGFTEYKRIEDFPLRGRSVYLHLRKRKWFDMETREVFTYDIHIDEPGTKMEAEFVAFLKGED